MPGAGASAGTSTGAEGSSDPSGRSPGKGQDPGGTSIGTGVSVAAFVDSGAAMFVSSAASVRAQRAGRVPGVTHAPGRAAVPSPDWAKGPAQPRKAFRDAQTGTARTEPYVDEEASSLMRWMYQYPIFLGMKAGASRCLVARLLLLRPEVDIFRRDTRLVLVGLDYRVERPALLAR